MVEKLTPTASDQTISTSPGSGQSVHKARRLARLGQNPSGTAKATDRKSSQSPSCLSPPLVRLRTERAIVCHLVGRDISSLRKRAL